MKKIMDDGKWMAISFVSFLVALISIFIIANYSDDWQRPRQPTQINHNVSISIKLSQETVDVVKEFVAELRLPPKVEPKKKEYEVYEPKIVPCQLSTGKPPVISEPNHIVLEGNETDPQSQPTSSVSLSETLPRKAPPASSRKTSASGKRPRSRSKQ